MVEKALEFIDEFFDLRGNFEDAYGILVLLLIGAFFLLVWGLCKAAKKEPEQ